MRAAGAPKKSSPFWRSSSDSVLKSSSMVSSPVIAASMPGSSSRRPTAAITSPSRPVPSKPNQERRGRAVGGIQPPWPSSAEVMTFAAPPPEALGEGLDPLLVHGAVEADDDDLAGSALGRLRRRREVLEDELLGALRIRLRRDLTLGRQRVPEQEDDDAEREHDKSDPTADRPPGMQAQARASDSVESLTAHLTLLGANASC